MLFMMIVKASKNSENGNLPSSELMNAMNQYNKDLIKVGVWVDAKGLHPSSNGLRISYPNLWKEPIVVEGPFTDHRN